VRIVSAVSRRPQAGIPEIFLGLLALAVAAVWIAHVVASTIHDSRHRGDTITITGSAHKPISSNLVEWSLLVSGNGPTRVVAASDMHREVERVAAFLRKSGLTPSDFALQVVQSETIVTRISKHKTRTSYRVSQAIAVSTTKLDVVQAAATRVGDLLEEGIDVSAEPLEWISTDLEDAKLQALGAATAETRRRADIIVKGLGGKLGHMRSSTLGVYQITPRNSTDVSNYGINDTSSRLKDVTAVVTATFAVDQ
jgi:uncharacterized protein